jgi:hypothetical protein
MPRIGRHDRVRELIRQVAGAAGAMQAGPLQPLDLSVKGWSDQDLYRIY